MRNFEEATTGFFGFVGADDFLNSLLGIKYWTVNAVFAILGALTTLITGYIWEDPNAIWTLWILMAADWTTGIIKGCTNKKFVSYKLWRMPLYYVATSFVISISWWMSKSSVVFSILPSIVIPGFYSVYFVSMFENLGEIGLLPKTIVTLLKKRFGLKKLMEKEQNK